MKGFLYEVRRRRTNYARKLDPDQIKSTYLNAYSDIQPKSPHLATILIMPLINCLAKLPFYALIVHLMIGDGGWGFDLDFGIYFFWFGFTCKGFTLFGFSVFRFVVAPMVAKIFSSMLGRGRPRRLSWSFPSIACRR